MFGSYASTCCLQVANALEGKVFTVGDAAYNATETSYWSTQEASLVPACVVLPQTSEDVARFISVVSRISNCNFAIKSQGHAPAAGMANVNGGVTVDLSWLNATIVSDDHSVASAGAGSACLDVYRALDPYHKTVAGGRNGAVGVGGLTLGGGISYYSPQAGWSCDTVANFEVVLPSSEIVNANATSHPDLFRALKGGGNNFGVVTRMDFNTLDTVPVRGGHLFQSSDYIERVLTAFAAIASADNYDVHASITNSYVFNVTTGDWTVVSVPVYTLPDLDPPVYRDLFSIPNITAESSAVIENISTLAAEAAYPQRYEAFFTSTYAASAPALLAVFDAANQTLQTAPSPQDVNWSLTFEPLPTVLTQCGQGANVLGVSSADGNAVILLVSVACTEVDSSGFIHTTAPRLVRAMDEAADALGGLHRFRYLNYANPSQDPIGSYGEENLEFLRNVSARYDPEGMFRRQVPGGFKLT
ncbi:FAD binding domain protein [Xylariaceae sp. FL0016]|nr:FAD binding domain protein [Xylariaceae sp. FL0016]